MKLIDDYDLIDQDYEEFLRRGREAFGIQLEVQNEPTGKDVGQRIDQHNPR